MVKRVFIVSAFLFLTLQQAFPQSIDTVSFKINTRLSFYTFENSGDIILFVPANLIYNKYTVDIKVNEITKGSWTGIPGKKIFTVSFTIDMQPGDYKITAEINSVWGKSKYKASNDLFILKYKSNEVKTDRLTGGLIVNKKPFFPFGFYCYFPVYPTLPEEEAVKGFNMISPYQKIDPESFNQRKAYMDRCAQLGIKVHYNLLSVSGGGGVGSKIDGLSDQEKKERLVKEINAFKDHPALLAWYIADEPNGYNIPPDSLIKIFHTVKELDPWHPVSIVFMAPFLQSKNYVNALDIVMADPYPLPDLPASYVGNVTSTLSSEFTGKRPLWIVPQAFGGGELWGREPTIQEIRSMTYQAIINGARGIQYFVRQGLNRFPKSPATWNECGRMAVETAELTPWLLSDEEKIPISSGSNNILVTSALHNGQIMIMAVNKVNSPQSAYFKISKSLSGKIKVLFENRDINITGGNFSDQMAAFGSQVYIFDLKSSKDTIKPWPGNLIRDPGFEDTSSPGVPSACYAWGNGERGATYFIDSQEHIEGNHSLRLITPQDNGSIRLRFFPVPVLPGVTYMISIHAKSDPERRTGIDSDLNKPQLFELSFGDYGSERFILDDEWQDFVTFVTIPDTDDLPPKTNVILQMQSAGVAWFDLLQVIKCDDINQSINPEIKAPWETGW
jgi:hypothetical protein